jgi:hypothetical protein
MKQNLALFFALSTIITGIYFFIEQPDQLSLQKNRKIENIFLYNQESKLFSFKTNKFEIKKDQTRFKVIPGNFFPDETKLDTILNFIQNIRARKIITETIDESSFFPTLKNSFTFTFNDNKTVKYTVGNRLRFSDEFYLMITSKNTKRIVIAYNSSPATIYGRNSDLQYKKLLSLLKLDPVYFK